MKVKLLVKHILFFSLICLIAVNSSSSFTNKHSFTKEDYESIKKKLTPEEMDKFNYESIRQQVSPEIMEQVSETIEAFKDNPYFKESQNMLFEYFSKQGVELDKEKLAQFYYEDIRGKNQSKCQSESLDGVFVLISFGLNKDYIKSLIDEAYELNKEYKGKIYLVIQGFVRDSLKETAKEIFKITGGKPDKAVIDINPDIFRDFEIKKVPYFIFKEKDKVRKMAGAVSIKYFLEKLETTDNEDMGVVGHTYEIKEKNFYDLLAERAPLAEQRLKELMKKATKEALVVKGFDSITPARQNKSFNIDPTYTLPVDIKNPITGEVLFAKGYTVNPADYVEFPRSIVVNLNRKVEVDYLLKNKNKFEVVLVAKGNIGDFMARHKIWVYKLMPEIVERFKISKTPSTIEQDGKMIKITEIALKD